MSDFLCALAALLGQSFLLPASALSITLARPSLAIRPSPPARAALRSSSPPLQPSPETTDPHPARTSTRHPPHTTPSKTPPIPRAPFQRSRRYSAQTVDR